ncbi:D-Ala-D-Ala carboxypeptidase family metallohydrolase [Providencia rustigianii]|uniref:D-Ala-D-Ala carboxypeptidase family metallohydrolase n=1 Tax=Providencia rustigianii TaxID=158850 RepID=UPI00223EA84B|nr:D-Ala-D-Ala carboxypeptidase family metallohydrolase [Providencia rustigianii]
MKLSEHFDSNEFACKDGCGAKQVESKLIEILEGVRAHFGKPVVIVSGRRCAKHNSKVDGAPKSQHLLGTAVDIKVKDVAPKMVADYLESQFPDSYGIGRYKTFTHIDVRGYKARWGSN